MEKNKKNTSKMVLTFGIIGLLAGIGLLFSGTKLIGIFGAIASAGVALNAYKDLREIKNKKTDID